MVARAIAMGLILATLASGVEAQESAAEAAGLYAPSVWELTLGSHASELDTGRFIDFACGTDGGPPSREIPSWNDFSTCPAEAESGLHEVYFEYDNELELWARAHALMTQTALYQYTSVYAVPVIASGLFDDDGFLVGMRLVTDPRISVEERERALSLANFLRARFPEATWDCTDLPRREGEHSYRGIFEKRTCESVSAQGYRLELETHQYRRAGQGALNRDNTPTTGEYWTETRFEMSLRDAVPDKEARLASIAAAKDGVQTPRELLIARAMDCPGCDLKGADFKRADLTGANLAGADLTGAKLHEAILRDSDLTGATLDGANLNGADLRRADLTAASVKKAMLYGAMFDGAKLDNADMSESLAGSTRMARASLTGAILLAVDFRGSRINDADFTGADLRFSWFHEAQMTRSDFSNARLSDTLLVRANLKEARLAGADLFNSDLMGSDLRGADLTGANFTNTNLSLVVMNSETVTTDATWTDAVLPGGFNILK